MQTEDKSQMRRADLQTVRLGRYPFSAGIKYYEARREPYVAQTTLRENTRKLRYFARVFRQLKDMKKVKTTDPRHMKRPEMEEFAIWMRQRNLSHITRDKYSKILKSYLHEFGNTVAGDIDWNIRSVPGRPIKALTVEELQRVFDASKELKGWSGAVTRGQIALAFSTGCRPSEIYDARLSDLNIEGRQYYVRNPKGSGSWATPEHVSIIREDMIPMLEEYRSERLAERDKGLVSPYLFPNRSTGKPYTHNAINRHLRTIGEITGISVSMKIFRATLASLTIAGDLSRLKAVSLQLRHTKVATTEQYYARINTRAEIESAIGSAWRDSAIER